MKGIIMGVNSVKFKSNLNPYAPVDTNAQQRFQRTEPYQSDTFEKKDNKNKNKKIIAGVLGAAAAIGLAILGLKKGLLEPGYDADLVLLNPDKVWTVKGADFKSKGKATPFEGKSLCGKVEGLFLSGKRADI